MKRTKTWKFQAENGQVVETDAISELAAKRKIRRLERKLSQAKVVRQRYGKLTRLKETDESHNSRF